jgi:predicted metallo-beta-lactamase superfamily hydrolase
LGGFRVEYAQLEKGICNLESIVESVPTVVLEHHVLRDEDWRSKIDRVFAIASEKGHIIQTAAEYAGAENNFLESKRKQLYSDQPPSEEFKKWTKTLNNKVIAKPPI